METNPGKFQVMLSNEVDSCSIPFGDLNITSKQSVRLLCVQLGYELKFTEQISELCHKAGTQMNVLQRLKIFGHKS